MLFIIRLWRYLLGYVEFEARQGFPERFLNLCAQNGISVWGMRRRGKSITGRCYARSYKALRPAARKSKVRLRIRKRAGAPFYLHRYRRRYGIFAGIPLFFAILYVLSLFIWDVNISGDQTVPLTQVRQALTASGLSEGTLRAGVQVDEVKQKLMQRLPGISNATFSVTGAFISVEVRDADIPHMQPDPDSPANLVAGRDGRVISVETYSGEAAVRPGDAVVKGDMLISGVVQYKTGGTGLTHAMGTVMAETDRTLSATVPYGQSKDIRTGVCDTRRALTFFGLSVPLYLGSIPEPYQTEYRQWQLTVGGVRLPLMINTCEFFPTETYAYTLTQSEAIALGRGRLAAVAAAEFKDVQVQSQAETDEPLADGVKITINYSCIENIAVEESILIHDGK